MAGPVLAIDQSGLRCRAVLFSADRRILASAGEELTPLSPKKGTVELNPEEIWSTTIATCRAALVRARVDPGSIAAIGIAGDSDTTLVWDRETGRPIHNAITAADFRTEARCQALRQAGVEPTIRTRTGLRLEASRAAPKLAWILDNVVSARTMAEEGRLAFGDIGCFLLARLTDGRVHATDATSAAASLLFNREHQIWDETLLDIFSVPVSLLPEVFDNATYFGAVDAAHFGGAGPIGIYGLAGTEQAALMGQGGLAKGSLSLNFSSGCAAMISIRRTGKEAESEGQIIPAARLDGKLTYAMLAANRAAGDAFGWARGAFSLAEGWEATDRLARSSDPDAALFIVPAKLTAQSPWHGASVTGLMHGLESTMTAADVVRAALETAVLTAADLVAAISEGLAVADAPLPPARVSGGLAGSDWAMQFLADMLDRPVERPVVQETVALGVAWLAGAAAKVWPDADTFAQELAVERRFEPQMPQDHRTARIDAWHRAVRLALSTEAASAG
jgi:glycerol kinase